MSLRLIEVRYDSDGKSFLALQGQTDEEAQEYNRAELEIRDRAWAAALNRAFTDDGHIK